MKSSRAMLDLPALVLALFTAALSVNATPVRPTFTRVSAPFVGVRGGAMAWGDYDNDGYLDLIVTGDAGAGSVMTVYHNNGNSTFTARPFALTGRRSSSVAWGDFDNDGYLDLLVTGLEGTTEIYRNLGGTNFVSFMQFPSVYDGQVKWGDMDNDGWLDFAITGAGPFSQIYHNLGGTNFVLLNAGLTQLYYGSVDWADYNHDGQLDLLVTGMSTSPPQIPQGAYLYRNDGNGQFTPAWFLNFFTEAGQWLDFDNDGWPDLAVQSWASGGLGLYRNDHAGGFNLAASLPMWLYCVGDFNSDGWSDLLIGTRVLLNSGIGLWPDVSTSLPSFTEAAACGDFNNDGKLDLVVWGQSDNGYLTYLYRNDVSATNLPPTTPGGLCAVATRTNVVLSWDPASDDHQTGGLTYNVRVGTTPGGCDVVSPMSAPNGYRQVVRGGNAGGLLQFKLCGLRGGSRYYWSVQAVDNSFAGSAFAAERSFVATVPPTLSGLTNVTVLRDSGALALPFVVGDLETPASNLVIAATSSNVQLVAPTDLVISRTDANRTLEITPEAGQTGTAIITVTVTDGDGGQTSQAFQYTVVAACVPTPAGLVSWWRAEGSPLDSAGTNDGSGPVAYQIGEVGSAFYENGSSWVNIPPSPGLDVGVGSGFSVEAWINPADLTGPGDKTIVAWVLPDFGPGIHLALTSNTDSHGAGALHAVLNSADLRHAELFSAGGIITTGAYQHLGFTYDRASGVLMNFCNGVVVAQDVVGPIAPNTGGALVTLGGSGYSGLLDEVSVYSRALSTSEILSIYNAGRAGKCFSGSPPEITTQPQSQFAWSGAKATFSATASSTSTLSYQWRKNGSDIAGATTSEYAISSVQPGDAGLYAVLVGNRAGAVLSSNAVLTVQVPDQPPFASSVIVGWGDPTWGAPTAPAGLTNVLAIAAGGYHSLALTLDGKVVGFGNNYYGQSSGPTAASNVVAIAAGWLNSFVVNSDGTVTGWGDDSYHQTTPPPGLSNVVAVAAGGYTWGHTLALMRDGTVVGWGTNTSGELDVPAGLTNVIAIAAGDTSSLALKSDGTAVGWGTANVPAGLSNVIAIACGAQHSLALERDGTVVAWASSGSTLGTEVPAGLSNVVGIAAGTFHSLALKSDGTVVGWGWNDYSQTRVPAGLSNVVALAAGELHSIALVNNGTPWLLWQPRPQATFIGLSADFGVVAIGAQPLSYQWQLNGTNVGGATTAHLVLTNVQSTDAGSYSVVVGNTYGSVTSSNAALSISASSPILLTQPADQSVLVGSNVMFVASAAGTPSLSYQWQFNAADIPGETNSVLLLPDVPASASGRYRVVVSNTLGWLASREAILNVYAVPRILVQPTNQTVVVGARAIFATLAQSLPPLYYQWQFNGTNIAGATNSVFTIDAVQFSDSGVYQVLLNNPLSSTSSFPAVLRVVDGAPVIVTPPVGQETYLGGAATFSVVAGGSPPLAYQWQFEGTNIADATDSLLAFSQVAYGQAGRYSVMVSNAFGQTPSTDAVLVIGPVIAWGDNSSGQTNEPPGLTNTIAIATRYAHNLALKSDGTVIAWGNNINGQCSVPPGLSNVVAVDAGDGFSLALKGDGTVVAWGATNWSPVTLPASLSNVVAIAAGDWHGLALLSNGTVVGWGRNDFGQASVPSGLSNVVAISAAYYHSLALKGDGTVVGWGHNSDGQAASPKGLSNVVAIAAGFEYNLALKSDGTVVGWGFNVYGESTVPAGLSNVVAIAAGGYHSLALRADGSIVSWGYNANGQTTIPPALHNVAAIGAGWIHSLALFNQGQPAFLRQLLNQASYSGTTVSFTAAAIGASPLTYQWQFNGNPIAGATNAVLTLTNIQPTHAGSYNVIAANSFGVVASSNATLTVLISGPVLTAQPVSQTCFLGPNASNITFSVSAIGSWPFSYQWQFGGTNIPGATTSSLTLTSPQLANGGLYRVAVSNAFGMATSSNAWLGVVPVVAWGSNGSGQTNVLSRATNVVAIGAGASYSLALRADGRVIAWGANSYGLTNVPPPATNVVAIAAGQSHSLALRADGTLIGWGSNSYGQTNVPAAATNVVAIAGGQYHSLALRADGSVIGWGYNGNGQTNVPSAATNVVAIAAGASHSLALRADGSVIGWGYNSYGQISVPSAATNVIAIAAGTYHSLAFRADGSVLTWGYTSYGLSSIPSGATNVVAIAAGGYHSLALRTDGVLLPWGDSSYGMSNVPAGATNAIAVSGGGYHNLALLGDGRPHLLSQPWNRTVKVGASVILSAPAAGAFPLRYQWQRNGTNVPGATTASCVLNNLSAASSGRYTVIVTNYLGTVTSAVVTVNLAPTAANIAAATRQGQPLSIAIAKLLALASDPDGDPLSLSGVSAASTNGVAVLWGSSTITYAPATNFVGADRFTYAVSDGRGGTAAAYVLISVIAGNGASANIFPPTTVAGGVLVRFAGIVGRSYTLQRAPSVSGPWSDVGTAVVGPTGIGSLLDTNPPPNTAFYRTTCP